MDDTIWSTIFSFGEVVNATRFARRCSQKGEYFCSFTLLTNGINSSPFLCMLSILFCWGCKLTLQ